MAEPSAWCPLCDPGLGPLLASSPRWHTVLNRNQHLLGACFIALRRHAASVQELTPAEWTDLHLGIGRIVQAIETAFAPDHINMAFLQNQDLHAHLHVIPRYAGDRHVLGETWVDPRYGDHYDPFAPPRRLLQDQQEALAAILRAAVSGNARETLRR